MQRVKNYGSVLQAYSLMKIINEINKDAEVSFLDPAYDEFYSADMPIIDSDDYGTVDEYKFSPLMYAIRKVRNHLIDKQFEKEILKFQIDELKLSDNSRSLKFDIVVEGSDEVFKCAKKIYRDLYGANENGDKIITYASSCGSADISGINAQIVSKVKEDMSRFAAMSVRDEHTKEYVGKLYDGQIQMHMDPVLMGNLNAIEHKPVKESHYMIVYAYANRIRTNREVRAIKDFARKHNLKTIAIGAPQLWCDKYISPSPIRILDYFYYADFVVTDTFHGTIFSVINHAQFTSIIRKTNRNKLGDLLAQLGLTDRILDNIEDLDNMMTQKIDYDKTDRIIAAQKIKTREYLSNQLR